MFCFLTKALIVIVDMLVHFKPKRTKQMNCPMNRWLFYSDASWPNIQLCVFVSFFNSPQATFNSPRAMTQAQVWYRCGYFRRGGTICSSFNTNYLHNNLSVLKGWSTILTTGGRPHGRPAIANGVCGGHCL